MISLYLWPPGWAHRIPAGWKLLALAIVGGVISVTGDPAWLAAALAGVVALYASLGLRALKELRRLVPLLPILVAIAGFHAVLGNWLDGVVVVERLAVMVLVANAVTMTTRMSDMLDIVSTVLKPLARVGVPVPAVAFAISLVVRFVPVLLNLWQERAEAHRARTGKRPSWRALGSFFLDAVRLADRVAESVDARGGLPVLPA